MSSMGVTGKKTSSGGPGRNRRERGARTAAAAASEATQGAPILVVDDDPTVRQLVARHLERAGFAVVTPRLRKSLSAVTSR